MAHNARTEAIEVASALILAIGSPRDCERRAYYHAYGRFADLLALAESIAPTRLTLVA